MSESEKEKMQYFLLQALKEKCILFDKENEAIPLFGIKDWAEDREELFIIKESEEMLGFANIIEHNKNRLGHRVFHVSEFKNEKPLLNKDKRILYIESLAFVNKEEGSVHEENKFKKFMEGLKEKYSTKKYIYYISAEGEIGESKRAIAKKELLIRHGFTKYECKFQDWYLSYGSHESLSKSLSFSAPSRTSESVCQNIYIYDNEE